MTITAQYTKDGTILADIDGVRYFIPDEASNRYRRMITAWEAGGNTIEAYSAPVPPLERISKLVFVNRLQDAGLFDVALAALHHNPLDYERWQASQSVDPENAEVLALISAIGGDATLLLAPAEPL